jgi:hypothetical protein
VKISRKKIDRKLEYFYNKIILIFLPTSSNKFPKITGLFFKSRDIKEADW